MRFAYCALLMPAMAAAQVTVASEYVERMDIDKDGRVALTEYLDWMSYAFVQMDVNHDGILAIEELPGGRGQPISLVEHHARLADTFRKQDRNHDGFLDAKELAAPPQ